MKSPHVTFTGSRDMEGSRSGDVSGSDSEGVMIPSTPVNNSLNASMTVSTRSTCRRMAEILATDNDTTCTLSFINMNTIQELSEQFNLIFSFTKLF